MDLATPSSILISKSDYGSMEEYLRVQVQRGDVGTRVHYGIRKGGFVQLGRPLPHYDMSLEASLDVPKVTVMFLAEPSRMAWRSMDVMVENLKLLYPSIVQVETHDTDLREEVEKRYGRDPTTGAMP